MALDFSSITGELSAQSIATNNATKAATKTTGDETVSEDRFLKLLVAQMQNQDPLNPLDNAQVTSQMAQINTVNGIEKLNTTVSGLNGQFLQMQTLQGASLVGRYVQVEGNKMLTVDGGGVAAFDLAGAADAVKVEVLNGAGQVVDTLDLGAESAGRHSFTWEKDSVAAGESYTFKVTATSGSAAVTSTALMHDMVNAVSVDNGTLKLDLAKSGAVAYDKVKAFN